MMNLYNEEGWLDVHTINALRYPFVFVLGGRGIGKTYGNADDIVHTYRGRVLFLRRTKTEFDMVSSKSANTFSEYNHSTGHDLHFESTDGFKLIEEGGEEIGVAAALSTFSNLRGGGFGEIRPDIVIYDEFIPESHRNKMRNECDVLLNMYETVNRNRELLGDPPLKLRCYSNSTDIGNAVFMGLGLVTLAEKLRKRDAEFIADEKRGVALILCNKSPISQRKKETALYKLSEQNRSFYEMAINNRFDSGLYPPSPRRIIEYKIVCNVGELGIYKHKAKNAWYVCEIHQTAKFNYSANDTDLESFRNRYYDMEDRYYNRMIEFASDIDQLLFLRYLKII